jgi:hypothetical protein
MAHVESIAAAGRSDRSSFNQLIKNLLIHATDVLLLAIKDLAASCSTAIERYRW